MKVELNPTHEFEFKEISNINHYSEVSSEKFKVTKTDTGLLISKKEENLEIRLEEQIVLTSIDGSSSIEIDVIYTPYVPLPSDKNPRKK